MRLTMRKILLALPACAILLAAAVLTSELGSALNAQTPDAVAAEPGESTRFESDDDISATSWVETANKAGLDTRTPKLPPPPAKAAKAKKKK